MRLNYLTGWDGLPFWREKGEGGREFRRVAGGLAWAWEELPGWLVVLGEERTPRGDGRHHIDVIHAWAGKDGQGRALDPRGIMAEACAVSVAMAFGVWASPGECTDAALVPMFNRELGRKDRKLALATPPLYERKMAFAMYDRLMERRTTGESSFHTGEEWRGLAREYGLVRAADRARGLEEFPAVAAALYALAWLELNAGGDGKETGCRRYEAATEAGY